MVSQVTTTIGTTSSTFYSVTITQTLGASPASGFIDNNRVEAYGTELTPSTPTTYALSQDKRRANWRYNNIVQQIGLMCNAYIPYIGAKEADANTPPTEFTFILQIDRGDGVLWTKDETIPGDYLTGEFAITRCIARALCATSTHLTDVFDPTTTTAIGNGGGATTSAMRVGGARIESLTVGALFSSLADAEDTITVTKMV